MNCIIPFESKVKFNSPVSEICSISLEHEITKNDSDILGNFIVYGEYKEYDLSMNTKDFKFTIPFSVELATRIDHDTLEFGIDNFMYDLDNNEMQIKIDYTLNADDIREEADTPVEIIEESDDLINYLNEESKMENNTIKEDDADNEDVEEERNEKIILPKLKEEIEEKTLSKESKTLLKEEITSFVDTESDYMTYHVHVIKSGETLESIALLYHTDKEELENINNITTCNENDKLLIPIYE